MTSQRRRAMTLLDATDQLRHLDHEGYAIFRGVLDEDLMRDASRHVAWLLSTNPGIDPSCIQIHTTVRGLDPFWYRLVSDDRLLDIAQLLIGPNIALFHTQYACKPPHGDLRIPWHQDGTSSWPIDPMEVVTLWVAVLPSCEENGCLRVLPGTHKRGALARLPSEALDERPHTLMADDVDTRSAVSIELASGDVSVHDVYTIHGSEPNSSPVPRIGLIVRYIPTTTMILADDWPCAFLLRGEAVDGINTYLPTDDLLS